MADFRKLSDFAGEVTHHPPPQKVKPPHASDLHQMIGDAQVHSQNAWPVPDAQIPMPGRSSRATCHRSGSHGKHPASVVGCGRGLKTKFLRDFAPVPSWLPLLYYCELAERKRNEGAN